MSSYSSMVHICYPDCQPVPSSCMPIWASKPASCLCGLPYALSSTRSGNRTALRCITCSNSERSSDDSIRPPVPCNRAFSSSMNIRLPSNQDLTRSRSRLSEVYDRMFPDPPPITHAPELLSPIETLDVTHEFPNWLAAIETNEKASGTSSPSDASTPPASPHIAFQNAEDGYRSVLMTTPVIGIDMPLTPPYTPHRHKTPLPSDHLLSPFTPTTIDAPEPDLEELSSPTSDTGSLISPLAADIALSTSISLHSPGTPQYTAHLVHRTQRSAHPRSNPRIYQFPLVPESDLSPGAFTLKTCNDWIENLGTPSTSRSRQASGASQLSMMTETPRDSVELCRLHDRSRNHGQDWTATMDLVQSSSEDLTRLDVQTAELQSLITLDTHDTQTLLPELRLPDWTLDIPVNPDEFHELYALHSELSPLRSILRQPSTDKVNILGTPRSVRWAPDDTLAQMRYISVDGNIFGVDDQGYRRPLTPAEAVKQAEYARSRKWI